MGVAQSIPYRGINACALCVPLLVAPNPVNCLTCRFGIWFSEHAFRLELFSSGKEKMDRRFAVRRFTSTTRVAISLSQRQQLDFEFLCLYFVICARARVFANIRGCIAICDPIVAFDIHHTPANAQTKRLGYIPIETSRSRGNVIMKVTDFPPKKRRSKRMEKK